MNIYLEMFGYVGTALVLPSMMMTSVVKLRLLNMAGSVISMTYAVLCGAWPVVFLNAGLILINLYRLLHLRRTDAAFRLVPTAIGDQSLQYYLQLYREDIARFFPTYHPSDDPEQEAYVVYDCAEAVGLLIGRREEDGLHVSLDYAMPRYRNCSVAKYLFDQLKSSGTACLITEAGPECHNRYLAQMGFEKCDNLYKKYL